MVINLPPRRSDYVGKKRDHKAESKRFWERVTKEKKEDPEGFARRNLERKLKKDPTHLFKQLIKSYSLKDFINEFLFIFNPEDQQYEKWICWPEQRKLCDKLQKSKDLGKSLFFLLKARRVGGSQIVAAYIVWKLLQGGNFKALVLSQTERDAKYFIKTIIGPILEKLPKVQGITWPQFKVTAETIEMEDGSSVEALPSSPDAGRGRTYNLVVMDEAAAGNFVYHADDNYQSVKHTVESAKGMMIVISTAKNGTWFNRMSKDTIDGKVLNAAWFFIGWKGVPNRTKKWYEAEASAASSDFVHRQEMPERWEDCFIARTGLVFPDFDPSTEGTHVKAFEPDWNLRVYLGYDYGFGEGSPHCFLICLYDKFRDHLYIVDEMLHTKIDASVMGQRMRVRLNEWQLDALNRQNIQRLRIAKAVADTVINREDRGVWEILKKHAGIDFEGAKKHDQLNSIAMLATRIKQNKITIHPKCATTIKQISGWVWETARSKRGVVVSKDRPVDVDDDACDVTLYICRELYSATKAQNPDHVLQPYSRKATEYRKQMKEKLISGSLSTTTSVNPWVNW